MRLLKQDHINQTTAAERPDPQSHPRQTPYSKSRTSERCNANRSLIQAVAMHYNNTLHSLKSTISTGLVANYQAKKASLRTTHTLTNTRREDGYPRRTNSGRYDPPALQILDHIGEQIRKPPPTDPLRLPITDRGKGTS